MRILTAGESHGLYEIAILEGFPCGVTIDKKKIDLELKRRMSGFGRGKRMAIETDSVEIVSGVRNKKTLGSPITVLIKNKDAWIFADSNDQQELLTVPRPAHADLSGALKYGQTDVRNILERASARETVSRVALGAICKQFLSAFSVKMVSFTKSVGDVICKDKPFSVDDILKKVKDSELACLNKHCEKEMIAMIEKAQKEKDSLGGVVEVWAEGVCPGIGNVMQYDRRLDAQLSAGLMSIPAVKGVEIGLGFDYSAQFGSKAHDEIFYSKSRGFYRKTNNSGGIEGGMSTGEPIVLRLAMKPIATLMQPLSSVDLKTKKAKKAIVERSDTCAIVALGVIAESMAAIVFTQAYLDKFGSDTLSEIKKNFQNYLERID